MSNISLASDAFKRNFIHKMDFYKKHPVVAGEELLDCDFPPAQRLILRELFEVSFFAVTASRGIGKSFMGAAEALLVAILIPNSKVLFVGPTFRVSKIMFTEMENILKRSKKAQIWLRKPPVHNSDLWKADFINGSTIAAMPLAAESESSIRGFRAHFILVDEMPHIPADIFNMVLTPMISTYRDPMLHVRKIEKNKRLLKEGKLTKEEALVMVEGNKLFGFTSAYFKFNHAYEKIRKFEDMRKEHTDIGLKPISKTLYFSYLDVPEGFINPQSIELARGTMPDFQFRMEWLSEWQNDSDGFYSRNLLDSCIGSREHKYLPETRGDRTHQYFMGIDPARTQDNFAVTIAKDDGGTLKIVRTVTFKDKSMPDYVLKAVRELIRSFPGLVRIYMDDGGGGLAFKDLLASRSFLAGGEDPILDMDDANASGKRGKRILKMVHFTPQFSTDYNFAFRGHMEKGGVVFPLPSPEGSVYIRPEASESDMKDLMMVEIYKMLREFQSIQVTANSGTGSLRFDGPKKNSETDRYTSALLCFAAFRDTILKDDRPAELADGGWLEDLLSPDPFQQEGDDLDVGGVVLGSDGELVGG